MKIGSALKYASHAHKYRHNLGFIDKSNFVEVCVCVQFIHKMRFYADNKCIVVVGFFFLQ